MQRRSAQLIPNFVVQLLVSGLVLCTSLLAWAAPEAKLLRIDPRTSIESGHPDHHDSRRGLAKQAHQ